MVNLETSASNNNNNNSSSGSADLLGLGLAGGNGGSEEASQPSVNGNGFSQEAPTNNLSKYVYNCNNVQLVVGFPFWVGSLNLRVSPGLNTQSCIKVHLCSTSKFENLCRPILTHKNIVDLFFMFLFLSMLCDTTF